MSKRNILITGGAGFIGCHVVHRFVEKYPEYNIIVIDALTYAGNLDNLKDIKDRSNFRFLCGDITDRQYMAQVFKHYDINAVIHLAAESHVDRSIDGPLEFVKTNVVGTCTLLEIARMAWKDNFKDKKFYHISTDEVYGALDFDDTLFCEETKYNPHSPYSASKASSDHFVRAYHDTYGMPVNISNCSNNYGPNQFPEKLIPLVISRLRNNEQIPVYGAGLNVRDWLSVFDHAAAIDKIFHEGRNGETYNIGGNNEQRNIDIVNMLIDLYCELTGDDAEEKRKLITHIIDRKGHDLRYAIDASKLKDELGWTPEHTDFKSALKDTVQWYLDNGEWIENIVSGKYREQKMFD